MYKVDEKPIAWVGSSKRDLRAFPPSARRRAGRELDRVQRGLEPANWKPMKTVGRGTREIRVRVGDGGRQDFRVIYVAKFAEAVYVLHAFEKKSARTSRTDLRVCRQRYQLMERYREQD